MVEGVPGRAAVRDDHGTVVSVGPEARRGTAGRHDDEHRDLQLHGVMGQGQGEVTAVSHDHTLLLLPLVGGVVGRGGGGGGVG